MKFVRNLFHIFITLLVLFNFSASYNLSAKNQELFLQCIKLKDQLRNDSLKCEKILFEENTNSNSKSQMNEKNRFLSDNTQEVEANQNISEDFEKVFNLVKREMNNLKQIEIEMNNFKKKLSKLNTRAEYSAKENENKFEMNDLKVDNSKIEAEVASTDMMGNLNMGNVNFANLENLLKMNLINKKKNENKIPQKAPQSAGNPNADSTSNSLNLSANDQKILKTLLKGDGKSMKDTSSYMNNSGDNESTAEVNKEAQVENGNNKVTENKKGNVPGMGMSLSEIEKQITMLKNLAIKSTGV